mmetsp:Transcript_16989/g.26311  ORF Transcript_16989/g.26311 Transcript_16989/m.26311 type:complete len:273 (-) Transcript_16989:1042-1860(-)
MEASGIIKHGEKPKALDYLKAKSKNAKADRTHLRPFRHVPQHEHRAVNVAPAFGHETKPREDLVKHILNSRAWTNAKPHTKHGALARCKLIRDTLAYGAHRTLPEMMVISATELLNLSKIPRWSMKDGGCPSVPASQVLEKHKSHSDDDRSEALIVFVSHRWLKPLAKGMHLRESDIDDEIGSKVHALCHWAEWVWDGNYTKSQKYVFEGHRIKEVYFWIDFCCVDQDNPDPFIPVLPLYLGICHEILCFETPDFDTRAWCRAERVMVASQI